MNQAKGIAKFCNPDIVNVAQVQSMLKISRHLAYELIGDGYIPGMKIGNATAFRKST